MTVFTPTAYDWPSAHLIPRREFLDGPAYQVGQVSLTVGSGGLGKSTLCLTEAVSMAGGFSLFSNEPMSLRVLYLSAEDDKYEVDRRIAGACAAHHAERSEKLYVNCVDGPELQVAGPDGLNHGVIENLIKVIQKAEIKVVIVDPFICTHDVSENDNSKIDKVARAWKRIAREAECAVHIVHHQAKDTRSGTDGARGASALRDAARYVRTLEQVSEHKELERLNLAINGKHVRIRVTKSNFHHTDKSRIFTLGTRTLPNGRDESGNPTDGDHVGVIELYPETDAAPLQANAKAGRRPAVAAPIRPSRKTPADDSEIATILDLAAHMTWKPRVNDPNWLGHAVAKALNLDPKIDAPWLRATFEDLVNRGLLEKFTVPVPGKPGRRVEFFRRAGGAESSSS